jgi:hypothetical protein
MTAIEMLSKEMEQEAETTARCYHACQTTSTAGNHTKKKYDHTAPGHARC